MNNYEIIFESERIYYVKVTEKLIEEYLELINDPELQKNIGMNSCVMTIEDEMNWVKARLEEKSKIFSMIEKETGKFIGNIEVTVLEKNIGELGIAITKEQQDKHFGQESIKRIIKYAFEDLKLKGLELNVFNFNERAKHCYEKVGFVEVGPGPKDNNTHMVYKKR